MEHFVPEISVELPRPGGTVLYAGDFGAVAQPGVCNTAAFRAAIDKVRALGGGTLVISPGVYHFYTAPEGVHLPLTGLHDLTIEGSGSEWIFHTPVAYIALRDCQRICLRNLTMDWAWEDAPLASVGLVTQVAPDGSWLDIRFPERAAPPDPFEIRIVGPFDPQRYTPGCPGGMEFRPYENQHIKLTGDPKADEEMRKLVRELSCILLPGAQRLEPDLLRFRTREPAWAAAHFRPGQCYNFRHFEYDGVAVQATATRHLTLERVTLYGCPGHGFLCSGQVSHLHFDHCRIVPRPGEARSVSVSVDCLHVGNSQGQILIEDCDFSGAGDDCINLHDNSSMGVRRLGERRLLALRATQGGMQLAAGSTIELRNPDLSPMGYTTEVVDAVYQPEERTCELTLRDPLPPALPEDTVIFHRDFHTDHYIIRNCRFTNNRARGMLLQGSHGLVENNVLENIQGAAIQIETGCESRWSEGQGVTDLLIRGNILRHCDLNAWQMAVIYMGVYLPGGRTDYPVFRQIEICHNTVVDCPRLAGFFSSCEGVEVHHNAIINAGQLDYAQPCYGSSTQEEPIYGEEYHGLLQFAHARNCAAYDNTIFALMDTPEHP